MSGYEPDPTEDIIENMEEKFGGINRHLEKLDNGGYTIEVDKKK